MLQQVLLLHAYHARQLRRAADPAKDLVKQWITQWSDAPVVVGNDSHTQIQGAQRCWCVSGGARPMSLTQQPYASLVTITDAMDNVRGCPRIWDSLYLTALALLRQRCLRKTARCSTVCSAHDDLNQLNQCQHTVVVYNPSTMQHRGSKHKHAGPSGAINKQRATSVNDELAKCIDYIKREVCCAVEVLRDTPHRASWRPRRTAKASPEEDSRCLAERA